MSRKLQQATVIAVAAMMLFTVFGAAGSGAFAQNPITGIDNTEIRTQAGDGTGNDGPGRFVSQEIVQPLPSSGDSREGGADFSDAETLGALVSSIPASGELSKDLRCLASAIYFEARGEPLLGQLAVGRVVVNRATSDRFPSTYCGVVLQPSQFSFIRSGAIPPINTSSQAWHTARAIAKIAHEDLWDSPTDGALFFHATHVQPGWRLTRLGRVSSHVFYR